MKICDAHVHLRKSGPWQPYINPTIYLNELISLFDKYNVERAKSVSKHPKRLIGFGGVDPRRRDTIKELSV